MASSITDKYEPIPKDPKVLAESADKDLSETEELDMQQYTQAIICVKCHNVVAYMGIHRHRPGPVICALCTARIIKEEAKKKKP